MNSGPVESPITREAQTRLDQQFMRQALELAEKGWGNVAPNPLVGAVVVRDGEVIGHGHHAVFGGSHAEVEALGDAGERARGSTLYVTLEPCAHLGKTPPCTRAILEQGVRRVVIATGDPNPESGGGREELAAAGVEVVVGVEEEAARRLNAPFLWRHESDTPYTALKLALSLDARLTARRGRQTAVTGALAAREVHRLRAGYDAVLVGRRTATVDDPQLTVRDWRPPRRPPVRVVLDPRLRLDPESRLARTAGAPPTWVVAQPGHDRDRRRALEAAGVRVLEVSGAENGGLDLPATWRGLASEGVDSLLVEGGGLLAGSLMAEGLVQRLYLFVAPVLFGSRGGEAFDGLTLDEPATWRVVRRGAFGPDTMIELERS